MIPAVIVFLSNHSISLRGQGPQVFQDALLFFKSGLPSAVNAQAHHPAGLQDIQPLSNRGNACLRLCGNPVIASRELRRNRIMLRDNITQDRAVLSEIVPREN